MKWFKHISDSGDDPDIDDAISIFGSDGYYVFFRTLEIMSREFDIENPGESKFSVEFFRKKFRNYWPKTQKILQFYQERERIFFKFENNQRMNLIYLKCPKLKLLCDEYTKKQLMAKSGQTPDALPTKEEEVEEDKEKDIKIKEQENFEILKNLSLKIIDKYSKFNPYQFIQWAIKDEGTHIACQLSDIISAFEYLNNHDGIVSPWAECRKIAESEKKKREITEREQTWENKKIENAEDIKKWLGTIREV